jgi:dipeptidyl aminopeptidase/acylaminoacyl peptidase
MSKSLLCITGLILAVSAATAQARPFLPDDVASELRVSAPDISPDGSRIVYEVEAADPARDKSVSQVWLASWDGSGTRQLTFRAGVDHGTPKFSPDGAVVGFLSSRDDEEEESQLWLLPLAGGEAYALPNIAGSVEDFVFSPDGKRLALIVADPDPVLKKDADDEDIPLPIVIDRYHFKVDGTGYLGKERSRLYLYDLAAGTSKRMTDGDFDETLPAWSPDGSKIAFVSRRGDDPDRSADFNIYLADTGKLGAEPARLTLSDHADGAPDYGSYPAWSPDGKEIAYVQGGDPKLIWYAATSLAVIPAAGGDPRILTPTLDRNVYNPVWAADGKAIRFVVEDDGKQKLDSVSAAGGAVTTLVEGEFVVADPHQARDGRIALLSSSPTLPNELFALDGGKLRQLSHHNEAWLKDIELGHQVFSSFKSKDGTEIHGFTMLPPRTMKSGPLPTMLHPHGGPASQYDYSFDAWQQVFAGAGYAVLTPNPRGSTGRGTAFSAGINAAWGSVDVEDDLAAVDNAVARGIADPDKLVVGGWSYGGMSTNYLIASDTRFKAAMAGASIANILAGYGTDMYILEYELELGQPWKNVDLWIKNSYPFFQVEKIATPTLFMVGDKDVNVPTWASEQMFQALKSRGVDTELVVYPGENHHVARLSFQIDRMQRWLQWYADHLK